MKMFVKVEGVKIKQVAKGFNIPPFEDAIEVFDVNIINNAGRYEYVNGEFICLGDLPIPPIALEPSVEEYLLDLDFRLSMIELGL